MESVWRKMILNKSFELEGKKNVYLVQETSTGSLNPKRWMERKMKAKKSDAFSNIEKIYAPW